MYLFLCPHFNVNPVLLFNRSFWLACAMMYFSVRQRSHLLMAHLFGVAFAVMPYFRLNAVSLRFNCQICLRVQFCFHNIDSETNFFGCCTDT